MTDNVQLVYYSKETKEFMRNLYKSLPERERRLYAAVEALKLEQGGQKYISEILGCATHTISKGIEELYSGSDVPEGYSRKRTAGAKKIINKIENIDGKFLEILKDKTAGSPMNEEIIWTNLKLKEISEEFENMGYNVTEHVVKQLLEKHGYKKRKMEKSKTLKETKNRNEQFENIEELKKEYYKSNNPIISMDVKKKRC